jgi:hypothetical protein
MLRNKDLQNPSYTTHETADIGRLMYAIMKSDAFQWRVNKEIQVEDELEGGIDLLSHSP